MSGKRDFAIEHGIPVPGPRGPTTELGKAVRQMKAGDSIVCETEGECDTVRKTIYALGGKAARRKRDGKWRVWRLE